jgi:mevalonate kinase
MAWSSLVRKLIASAPGSLMLMGEHAILHGQPALVAAIDQRIQVTLTPLTTSMLQIESVLDHYQAPLNQLTPNPSLRFVLMCVQQIYLPYCHHDGRHTSPGLHIHIDSDIDPKVGLGSSAALTVALSGALSLWCGLSQTSEQHLQQARHIVQQVQGRGSGADVAASLLGGVVHYQMQPPYAQPIDTQLTIAPVYCGYKTPTAQVISHVAQLAAQQPQRYQTLYQTMGDTTRQAISALKHQDYTTLAQAMSAYQQHLRDLGVSDATLEAIITELTQQPDILAAKISGSGLGDCVIALLKQGTTQPHCQQGVLLPAKLSLAGYRLEQQNG